MSTIVVGYDGSAASRAAIGYAVERLPAGGKLIVVHAYQLPSEYLGSPYYQDLIDRAVDRASAVLDDIERDCPSITTVDFEPDVVQGAPAEAVCRVASHRRAEEIVIGTRGVSRVHGLLGSVAHDVLHLAHCPVLVVPARAVESRRPAPTALTAEG